MSSVKSLRILASGALLIVLAACSPSAPMPNESSSASAPVTASPAPTVDSATVALALSPDELSALNSAGDVITSVSLDSDVSAAIDLLQEVFGTAPELYTQETGCSAAQSSLSSWRWGDPSQPSVTVDSWATWDAGSTWREANDFVVRFSQPIEAGIALETSEGVSVGDGADEVFAGVPPERLSQYYGDSDFIAVTDVGGSFESQNTARSWGVVVVSQAQLVWAIASPSSGAEFFC
jgi:hypothetical protein